jgi:hypothetical protein
MKWMISDKELTGPVDFDMQIETIKSHLGDPDDSFKRTPDSDDVIIAFDNFGIHVTVNKEGMINQLTIFPDNEVFIGDVQLINTQIDSIYEKITNLGVTIDREEAGLWCEKYKVFLVEVDGRVDGVEIYRDQLLRPIFSEY